MADNPFGDIGSDLISGFFGGAVWLGLGLILAVVLVFAIWYFGVYRRKFDIIAIIKSDRADDKFRIIEDKAAILYNKTDKSHFLRLLHTKVDLPSPPYWIIQKTNKGDMIEIWRKSEDDFTYLIPGRIDKERVVRTDKTIIPIAQTEYKQLEGDIAYWNVKRKEKNKALFDNESILMKLLPFIPIIIGGIIMVFMLYILFDSLPGLIQELTRLASELRSLKGAEVTTHGIIWPILTQLG